MPTGCNEQTFNKWYPNILALKYLKSVGKLTKEKEDEIKTNINSGLQKILQIARSDGSFNFWEDSDDSNVWLTAYISKLIIMTQEQISIRNRKIEKVLKNALDFIKRKQTGDGGFKDDSVYYQEEVGISKSKYIFNFCGKL